MNRPPALALKALLLAICAGVVPVSAPAEETGERGAEPPANAPQDTCWETHVIPAVIETVTEQVMVEPAGKGMDGTVKHPTTYRTETRQAIVRQRKTTWFEIPCRDTLAPDFTASLQRALRARDIYRGRITGEMDAPTRTAIRAYQAPQGLDSGILSLKSARKLGLVAIERDAAEH